MTLYIATKFEKLPTNSVIIDCTSASGQWSDLSPFLIPGGELYQNYSAKNMENAWQFAKLYAKHADNLGQPTPDYWKWAQNGWNDIRAHRYPMGKGAVPLCSLWNGEHLGYIDARKRIYAPLYARAVTQTLAFKNLVTLFQTSTQDIYLRDYDGYNHKKLGMNYKDVINFPKKKMGHAFVLGMLLEKFDVPGNFEAAKWLQSTMKTPIL